MLNSGRPFFVGLILAATAALSSAPTAKAAEMYRQFESTRGLAMGGALTSAAIGLDALLYNPAGLIQDTVWKLEASTWQDRSFDSDGRSSIGFFRQLESIRGRQPTSDIEGFLNTDGREGYAKRKFSMAGFHTDAGFAWASLESEGLYYTPEFGGTEPRFNLRHELLRGGIAGFAYTTRWRLFSWGFNLKRLSRSLRDDNLGPNDLVDPQYSLYSDQPAIADNSWDAGFLMRLPIAFLAPSFSMAILNGSPMDFTDPVAPKLETEINMGLSVQPQLVRDVRILLTMDIRDFTKKAFPNDLAAKRRQHYGTEISFVPLTRESYLFNLRSGLSQGFFSFGFGVNLGKYVIVNFADYYEDIGDDLIQIPRRRQQAELKIGF